MKRFVCLFLVLIVFPVVSVADLPDISGLDKDELLQLSNIVNNALFEKSLPDGVLLPAGDYIVGVDLPAGEYRADVVSTTGGIVKVYRSKEDAEKHPMSYLTEISLGDMWGTLVFRLVLEDNNYIQLKYNSLKLYPYAGLVDMSIPKE